MSLLFPLQYVYVGNGLIGILLLIAVQQICQSLSPQATDQSLSIRYKVLTCLFILATYTLNCLLIYHYLNLNDHDAVTRARLLTSFTFCLGALTTFDFVTLSFDTLYKIKSPKNEQKSPKWFIVLWKLSMTWLILAVCIGSFCAYYFQNGQIFNLYYIVIDICIIIGGTAVIFAMIVCSEYMQIVSTFLVLHATTGNKASIKANYAVQYFT